jgi:hypothetical protein
MRDNDAKSAAPAVLGAVLGLALSVGPVLVAHVFPRAASLRMLGACLLGGIIGFGACRWR